MRLQIVGYTLGILITIVGLAAMVPALIDWRGGHSNAEVFLFNGIMCLFFGGSLMLANRNHKSDMTIRQAFLLTTASWFLVSAFCAMPLYMADIGIGYTDAYFEAVSAVTTTGSTVLSGLNDMSQGLLFWRSLMQWVGGLGIIAFAIVFLPHLKVGGMQLFRAESSGHMQKALPRSSEMVGSLLQVYTLLTALCASVYYALGMSWFEAINHAMTTICTGGFSIYDESFGYFDSPYLHYAAVIFMLAGAIPFILYVRMVFQNRFLFFRDEQVRAFFVGLAAVIFAMSMWLWMSSPYTLAASFQFVSFNVVSVVSTTGYATIDYTAWGGFAVLCFLILTYLGGCAGSTSGGMKIMRIVVACKVVGRQFKTLLYPNGSFVLNYQGRRLRGDIVMTVFGFLSMYVVMNAVITIVLAMFGLDFITALSAAATALANVGPGLGEIGPAGNFAGLPDPAKWTLSVAMIFGRLEILTIMVLFSALYWQR